MIAISPDQITTVSSDEPAAAVPGVRFASPFAVATPTGAEGWESMYPYYSVLSEARRADEESRFWFFDGMHNPEPMYPFDTIATENWWVAVNQIATRVWPIPLAVGSTIGSSTATSTSARPRSPIRRRSRRAPCIFARPRRPLLRELGRDLCRLGNQGDATASSDSRRSPSSRCPRSSPRPGHREPRALLDATTC